MVSLKKLFICLVVSTLALTGCKTTLQVQESAIKPVPGTYSGVEDTSNSVAMDWKAYFSDSILIGLIDTALKNNLDLLMASQWMEAVRSEVIFTRGRLFPVVEGLAHAGVMRFGKFSADWAGNEGEEYSSGDPFKQTAPDYYIGFQSSWEIDLWGKLRNQKKAAAARYMASMEGRNWVITNLISEIANTYYELLALDNELQIIRESISLGENALSVVKNQKEAGVANELAVQQFEAGLLSWQALEKELLQEIIETENLINLLLGRFPQAIFRDPTSFTESLFFKAQAGIPSELLENRPDIRQAGHELAASRADVKSARAAFFPSLNITGTAGFNAFDLAYFFMSPQSIAINLFGSLMAPLINRSAIQADFHRANAAQLEALYNYQKSIITGYVEVANELSDMNNLEEIYELKNKEVDILMKSIEASSDLFRTGRANYLEILLAQQNALQAKRELTDTRKRQYQTWVNIYKALGGGWR